MTTPRLEKGYTPSTNDEKPSWLRHMELTAASLLALPQGIAIAEQPSYLQLVAEHARLSGVKGQKTSPGASSITFDGSALSGPGARRNDAERIGPGSEALGASSGSPDNNNADSTPTASNFEASEDHSGGEERRSLLLSVVRDASKLQSFRQSPPWANNGDREEAEVSPQRPSPIREHYAQPFQPPHSSGTPNVEITALPGRGPFSAAGKRQFSAPKAPPTPPRPGLRQSAIRPPQRALPECVVAHHVPQEHDSHEQPHTFLPLALIAPQPTAEVYETTDTPEQPLKMPKGAVQKMRQRLSSNSVLRVGAKVIHYRSGLRGCTSCAKYRQAKKGAAPAWIAARMTAFTKSSAVCRLCQEEIRDDEDLLLVAPAVMKKCLTYWLRHDIPFPERCSCVSCLAGAEKEDLDKVLEEEASKKLSVASEEAINVQMQRSHEALKALLLTLDQIASFLRMTSQERESIWCEVTNSLGRRREQDDGNPGDKEKRLLGSERGEKGSDAINPLTQQYRELITEALKSNEVEGEAFESDLDKTLMCQAAAEEAKKLVDSMLMERMATTQRAESQRESSAKRSARQNVASEAQTFTGKWEPYAPGVDNGAQGEESLSSVMPPERPRQVASAMTHPAKIRRQGSPHTSELRHRAPGVELSVSAAMLAPQVPSELQQSPERPLIETSVALQGHLTAKQAKVTAGSQRETGPESYAQSAALERESLTQLRAPQHPLGPVSPHQQLLDTSELRDVQRGRQLRRPSGHQETLRGAATPKEESDAEQQQEVWNRAYDTQHRMVETRMHAAQPRASSGEHAFPGRVDQEPHMHLIANFQEEQANTQGQRSQRRGEADGSPGLTRRTSRSHSRSRSSSASFSELVDIEHRKGRNVLRSLEVHLTPRANGNFDEIFPPLSSKATDSGESGDHSPENSNDAKKPTELPHFGLESETEMDLRRAAGLAEQSRLSGAALSNRSQREAWGLRQRTGREQAALFVDARLPYVGSQSTPLHPQKPKEFAIQERARVQSQQGFGPQQLEVMQHRQERQEAAHLSKQAELPQGSQAHGSKPSQPLAATRCRVDAHPEGNSSPPQERRRLLAPQVAVQKQLHSQTHLLEQEWNHSAVEASRSWDDPVKHTEVAFQELPPEVLLQSNPSPLLPSVRPPSPSVSQASATPYLPFATQRPLSTNAAPSWRPPPAPQGRPQQSLWQDARRDVSGLQKVHSSLPREIHDQPHSKAATNYAQTLLPQALGEKPSRGERFATHSSHAALKGLGLGRLSGSDNNSFIGCESDQQPLIHSGGSGLLSSAHVPESFEPQGAYYRETQEGKPAPDPMLAYKEYATKTATAYNASFPPVAPMDMMAADPFEAIFNDDGQDRLF